MTVNISNEEGKWIARIEGRLDTTNSEEFGKNIEILIQNADKQIVLDCKDLAYISSSGLRQFLTLRKATMAKGGGVTITNMNNELKEVFTLTGFINLFDFA